MSRALALAVAVAAVLVAAGGLGAATAGTTGTTIPGMGAVGAPAQSGATMGTVEDDPEVLHAAYKKKAEQDYNAAVKARASGDTETAVRLLLNVVGLGQARIDSPYPQKAADDLAEINAQGLKELAVARALVSGEDPPAGLSELKRITRVYSGLPPAKQAGALVLQLEKDPQFQAALRLTQLTQDLRRATAMESEAAALLAGPAAPAAEATKPATVGAVGISTKVMTEKEREAARIARLLEAYELYGRIVQQGAGTDPAKQASSARARLEQDTALMVRIKEVQAERKAREWLGLAEAYLKADRADRAREFCQKILAEYPQTPQAAAAKDLLNQMK
jgi:tetratricopeptide (TPR) repeat protein